MVENVSAEDREFIEDHPSAAMITVGEMPKVARVAVALIDGRLWSSGTDERARTRRLRRDPRCTLYIFDAGYRWLALETTVRILDGPDAPEMNLEMFRKLQNRPSGSLGWFGKEYTAEEFLHVMVKERRLIYEFDVQKAYGLR
jgi:hypothetical protein